MIYIAAKEKEKEERQTKLRYERYYNQSGTNVQKDRNVKKKNDEKKKKKKDEICHSSNEFCHCLNPCPFYSHWSKICHRLYSFRLSNSVGRTWRRWSLAFRIRAWPRRNESNAVEWKRPRPAPRDCSSLRASDPGPKDRWILWSIV